MKRKTKANKAEIDLFYESQYQAALKAANMYFHNLSKAKIWMGTQNPLLGNISPDTMLKIGRFDKLQQFIYDQMSENSL